MFKYLSAPIHLHRTADKGHGEQQELGEDSWDAIQNYMGSLVENS